MDLRRAVQRIAEHPAFRNCARMLARLHDELHADRASGSNVIATDTEWGDGFTHRALPRSYHCGREQMAARGAIAAWARVTYGWLGRSPDYKAAFLATLGANAEFYAPFEGECASLVPRTRRSGAVRQSRHHPSAARSTSAAGRLRQRRLMRAFTSPSETDAGIHVRGSQGRRDGSALTHFTFVAHHGLIPVMKIRRMPRYSSCRQTPLA